MPWENLRPNRWEISRIFWASEAVGFSVVVRRLGSILPAFRFRAPFAVFAARVDRGSELPGVD